MKQWNRAWLLVIFGVHPFSVNAHSSFQCLAELETHAFAFANCSGTGLTCDEPYQALIKQTSSCRDEGFGQQVLEQAIEHGYAHVPHNPFIASFKKGEVAGHTLSASSNWSRFRQGFGGFFDHDYTLLSIGFSSERCGKDIEGGEDRVHWVARLKFSGINKQQTHQWDFFERVEPGRCYPRTPDSLLVANIPSRFLKFYKGVWLKAFANQGVVECQNHDECQTYVEQKNRQFFHYRALNAAIEQWKDCELNLRQSQCMAEDWKKKISQLEIERDRTWQAIEQAPVDFDVRS